MTKILAGIDLDVDKSRFSLINGEHIELQTLSFFDIFKQFKELILLHGSECITVYIECGFLNKSNWHKRINQSASANAKNRRKSGC